MNDWLVEALEYHQLPIYPWRDDDPDLGDVLEGDVLVVSDMDRREPSRMVAVLEVEPERRCFLGALVTNELALATAEDIELAPAHTGLPYHVAGLAGVARWFWHVQIRSRLGALTDEALNALSAGHCGVEDRFHTSHRGVPLQERLWDLRWSFFDVEDEQFQRIAQDCTGKRWDEDIGLPYLDPRLLPAPGDSRNGFHTETLGILEEATREGRTRGFSPSCVEQVAGTLDCRVLRAYPTMFQPTGSMAVSPPLCPDTDDASDWLLELTRADALEQAPFVKMIGADKPSGPKHFDSNGRRYEFLYECVGGTSG